MFIIEGPDHVGKTTAAKRLVELAAKDGRYPIRYQHMSRQNSAFNYGSDYLDLLSKYAVQDRFHLGARVYHEPGTLSDTSLRQVKLWLKDVASVVVIMFSSSNDWLRGQLVDSPKEEMFSMEKIIEANETFYAHREHADILFDVAGGNFPNDGTLRQWLRVWYDRMDKSPNTRRDYIAR